MFRSACYISIADLNHLPAEVSAILRDAWDGFRRGFVLAYAGRAGLGVMTRALSLVRRRQFSDALGWRLLSEKTLVYRRAAPPAPCTREAGSVLLCMRGLTASRHPASCATLHRCMAMHACRLTAPTWLQRASS